MNLAVLVFCYLYNVGAVACNLASLAQCGVLNYNLNLQGAQAVGMGKDAQSVPTAAELYKKANDILGYSPIPSNC